MSFKEKSGEMVTFGVKDMELIGEIISITPSGISSPAGVPINSYILAKDNGVNVQFLGTSQIDRLLSDELNSRVKIVYTGENITRKGYRVKTFRIFIDDGKTDVTPEVTKKK